jgi:transcriptional regulator with XRE-family HTH domain
MKTNFGEWLKLQLEERDMKQSELAEKIGVQPPQISRIISGEREPTTDVLTKIAHALRIPRKVILRVVDIMPPDPDEDPWVEEMSYKISLLSPSLRSVAERLIDSLAEGEEREQQKAKSKPKTRSSTP